MAPIAADEVVDLHGLVDQSLGNTEITLTAKVMVVRAARTPNIVLRGVAFNAQTGEMRHDDANDAVYFGLIPA